MLHFLCYKIHNARIMYKKLVFYFSYMKAKASASDSLNKF